MALSSFSWQWHAPDLSATSSLPSVPSASMSEQINKMHYLPLKIPTNNGSILETKAGPLPIPRGRGCVIAGKYVAFAHTLYYQQMGKAGPPRMTVIA